LAALPCHTLRPTTTTATIATQSLSISSTNSAMRTPRPIWRASAIMSQCPNLTRTTIKTEKLAVAATTTTELTQSTTID